MKVESAILIYHVLRDKCVQTCLFTASTDPCIGFEDPLSYKTPVISNNTPSTPLVHFVLVVILVTLNEGLLVVIILVWVVMWTTKQREPF